VARRSFFGLPCCDAAPGTTGPLAQSNGHVAIRARGKLASFAMREGFAVRNVIQDMGSWSLVVLLTACAAAEPTPEQAAADAKAHETIDQILSAPLASDDYSKPERCLSTFEYDQMEVLDDQHVLFKGNGDDIWLNKLRMRCIGLTRNSTPVIRLRDTQVCDMDTFQSMDTMLGMWHRTSATCSLGEFTPVTEEQAKTIEAALTEARKAR